MHYIQGVKQTLRSLQTKVILAPPMKSKNHIQQLFCLVRQHLIKINLQKEICRMLYSYVSKMGLRVGCTILNETSTYTLSIRIIQVINAQIQILKKFLVTKCEDRKRGKQNKLWHFSRKLLLRQVSLYTGGPQTLHCVVENDNHEI